MSKGLFYPLTKFQTLQLFFPEKSKVYLSKQNLLVNKEVKYYPFINLIRFVSMIGIVWMHTNYYTGYKDERTFLNTVGHIDLYIAFFQVFKFGTICFFLISGFLLGDKIKTGNLINYYRKRIQSTSKPYLFVFSIFVVLYCLRLYLLHRDLPELPNHNFKGIILYCLFESHLWFIPNYLIALLVILIFSKFIIKGWFGCILFALTVLYSVLIVYTVKYHASHTTALLGFIFYLWLGHFVRNNAFLLEKIRNIKIVPFTIILLLVFAISCIESYKLYQNGLDYFNTLRLGNQLYSITMFAFLIRIGNNVQNFGWFNPRKETYGIYLYHAILSGFVMPVILKYLFTHQIFNISVNNIYTYIIYHIIYFGIVYLSTTLIVKTLLRYNLGYLQITIKA